MRSFIRSLLKNEIVQAVGIAVGVCVACLIVFAYLLQADISKAPEFIYSQF